MLQRNVAHAAPSSSLGVKERSSERLLRLDVTRRRDKMKLDMRGVGPLFLVAALAACAGEKSIVDPGPGPQPDTLAPSTPANLSAVAGSSSRIDLLWRSATDNVGVTSYRLFRDDALIASVTDTTGSDGGRVPGVSHCYAVSARDSSGNESPRSAPACAATVNQAPQAFLAEPPPALTGELMLFDASGSRDNDGAIATYAFDWGDGTPVTVVNVSGGGTQHGYAAAGIYSVTLTVTDNFGAQATYTRKASVGAVLLGTANVSNTPNTYSQRYSFSGAGSGPINVVWEELPPASIFFTRSTNGGSSFAPLAPVIAATEPYQPSNGYQSSQMRVVTAGTDIHVVWTIFDVFEGLAEDFYARSSDGGATFSSPLLVTPNDRVNSTGPTIAADTAGTVAITWTDPILFTDTPGAGFSVSIDTGHTFLAPILFPGTLHCSNTAISGDNIFVAWLEGPSFQEQVQVAHSANRGTSFAAPEVVDPSTERSSCPQMASGAEGSVFIVWQESETSTGRILLSRAAGGGSTFSEPERLSPVGVGAYCPAIAVGDGRLYVAWTSYDSTAFNIRNWLVFSTDGGVTFSPPRWIPSPQLGAGCFDILARGPNEVGLAWNATVPDTRTEVFYTQVRISVP